MRVLLAALAIVLVVPSAAAKPPPPPIEAAVVPTGRAPCGVISRAGSLWIGVYEDGILLKMDDTTGRTESRVRVGQWACAVAVGPASVWVARDNAGELVRVSGGTGRIQRLKVGTGTYDVLLAAGSVWTTSFDHALVVRTDPRTGRSTRLYKLGPYPTGLASCGGRVWVGHGRAVTWLTAIDPRTHRMRRVPVGLATPRSPVCIRGVVWVTTLDTVVRVDARTGRVLSRLRIGETLGQAAEAHDGLVWVTDKQHSVIHRLTPDGRVLVDSFPAGPGAFALARAGDATWVTSFAGSDVRRYSRTP